MELNKLVSDIVIDKDGDLLIVLYDVPWMRRFFSEREEKIVIDARNYDNIKNYYRDNISDKEELFFARNIGYRLEFIPFKRFSDDSKLTYEIGSLYDPKIVNISKVRSVVCKEVRIKDIDFFFREIGDVIYYIETLDPTDCNISLLRIYFSYLNLLEHHYKPYLCSKTNKNLKL